MPESSEYLGEFRPRLRQPDAGALCRPAPCLTTDDSNDTVLGIFTSQRDLVSLPVVEAGRPIGLINRNIFMSQMSQPFRLELYGRKSCIAFMDKEPLVVEASVDLEALTFKAVAHGEKALADGFVITRDGIFVGVGSGLQLMRVVADLQASRNRQIMHSIEYASVIQQSTLRVSREALARACPRAALVWEPRDVVGGDFYQFAVEPDGWMGTIADCTGHGVPGAFMTLIASTSLNQAIVQHGTRDPARLLGSVNRSIKTMLGQTDGHDETPGSDDGMDAACFWWEPGPRRIVFAGARLALFVVPPDADAADAVETMKGQRKGVGYVDSEFDFAWTNQERWLAAGSLVFITTDGLIDQIGGPRALAFGKRRLREILLKCRHRNADDIARAVLDGFAAWQGDNHRRDDLTFFCFHA